MKVLTREVKPLILRLERAVRGSVWISMCIKTRNHKIVIMSESVGNLQWPPCRPATRTHRVVRYNYDLLPCGNKTPGTPSENFMVFEIFRRHHSRLKNHRSRVIEFFSYSFIFIWKWYLSKWLTRTDIVRMICRGSDRWTTPQYLSNKVIVDFCKNTTNASGAY